MYRLAAGFPDGLVLNRKPSMTGAERAVEAIRRAREYTNHLLGHIATEDWFRMPHEGVSHVAWQVGHLAYAPTAYPTPAEIRQVFDSVHRRSLEETSALSDAVLAEPASPHARFSTKGGALTWCAEHEMLHAGQIGLLRRLLGQAPL
jgi:uncharacterized damage-inducible protein DinB